MYKDFIQTKLVSDFEAKMTKISIKVPSYEVVKAGFFSSDYCVYLVESECEGRHKVNRKESDFYMLRKVLRQQYSYVIVPPLPPTNKKLTEKVLSRRQRHF